MSNEKLSSSMGFVTWAPEMREIARLRWELNEGARNQVL